MSDEQLADSYVLEASEAEHSRLIALAQQSADSVRELCARAGLREGARLADIGCGPIGALVQLAEIAGPQGSVIGIDSSAEAVNIARAIAQRQGLSTVKVVHGDIHTLHPAEVMGETPLDAVHLRAVLIHQPDPVLTLRHAAALVRPGGQVLVADVVTDPRYPSFDPPLPVHETIWELLFATSRRRGASIDAARRLPNLCEEAGLRVVHVRGGFWVIRDAKRPIEATRIALQGARRAVVSLGVATDAADWRFAAGTRRSRTSRIQMCAWQSVCTGDRPGTVRVTGAWHAE